MEKRRFSNIILLSTQYYMSYFTTKVCFFVSSLTNDVKETKKIEDYLQFLEESGVGRIIELAYFNSDKDYSLGGRPNINPFNLFAVILLGFTVSTGSLRKIEALCKYDLRFMHIMGCDVYPSYQTIGNFINDIILPNIDDIYSCLMSYMAKKLDVEYIDAFIDGTKIEAKPNKYKFVWKPIKYHLNLTNKVNEILDTYDFKKLKDSELISSTYIEEMIEQVKLKLANIDLSLKINKQHIKNVELLNEFLLKCKEYETKERICGPNRNSYYKTDFDATAMCLKRDYYSKKGTNMHAAYNVQILVINGLIMTYYLSQSRVDIDDFIPTMERVNKFYKCYPKNAISDAGYGNKKNYTYIAEQGIGNYIKHQSWEGNITGKNPRLYTLTSNGEIICLNNIVGKEISIPERHHKIKNGTFYKIEGCKECIFKTFCMRQLKTKYENHRIFEIDLNLIRYIKEAENNLLSPSGIEKRVNRSIQVEGAFGNIKNNYEYDRIRRVSLKKIDVEIALTCLGVNFKKLFKYFDGTLKQEFWKAPKDLKSEEIKKPSAKRLANKAKKYEERQNKKDAKT